MIFVESSVWIDLFREVDSPETAKLLDTTARDTIIGDIVLYEVLRGTRDDRHARRIERRFDAFLARSITGPKIAIKAAANCRKLRAIGVTIRKDADVIIGTLCIENEVPLLHNDRDFLPMVEHLGLVEY